LHVPQTAAMCARNRKQPLRRDEEKANHRRGLVIELLAAGALPTCAVAWAALQLRRSIPPEPKLMGVCQARRELAAIGNCNDGTAIPCAAQEFRGGWRCRRRGEVY